MQQINIDELKTIQLSILDYIHTFCMKNNIRYSLCGGTLIGAVRHKGYIPWDDDIDIIMPRPDYMKFIKLYNNRKSVYKVNSLETDPCWYSAFAEVAQVEKPNKISFSLNKSIAFITFW